RLSCVPRGRLCEPCLRSAPGCVDESSGTRAEVFRKEWHRSLHRTKGAASASRSWARRCSREPHHPHLSATPRSSQHLAGFCRESERADTRARTGGRARAHEFEDGSFASPCRPPYARRLAPFLPVLGPATPLVPADHAHSAPAARLSGLQPVASGLSEVLAHCVSP